MGSLASKITAASRLQLVFLSLTWLAGIDVNGFVAILPGTGAGAILVDPSVAAHVVLAVLSAATSVFILALAWADGSNRAAAYSLLAVVALVAAGYSGISFVLGGGSSASLSMSMAAAFIAALFLTFLALADIKSEKAGSGVRREPFGRYSLPSGALSLALFFGVFLSGMYVNLYVAGPSTAAARKAGRRIRARGELGSVPRPRGPGRVAPVEPPGLRRVDAGKKAGLRPGGRRPRRAGGVFCLRRVAGSDLEAPLGARGGAGGGAHLLPWVDDRPRGHDASRHEGPVG